jgi:hypothetical protein
VLVAETVRPGTLQRSNQIHLGVGTADPCKNQSTVVEVLQSRCPQIAASRWNTLNSNAHVADANPHELDHTVAPEQDVEEQQRPRKIPAAAVAKYTQQHQNEI